MRRCSSKPSPRNLCREVTVKAMPTRERVAKEALFSLDNRADSFTIAKLREGSRNLRRDIRQLVLRTQEGGSRAISQISQDLGPSENEDNLLVDLRMFHDKKARAASHFDDNPVIQDMLTLAQRNRSSILDTHQHGLSGQELQARLLSPPAKELRKMHYMLLKPPKRRSPPPEHKRSSAQQDPFRSNRSSVASRKASNRELQIPRLPLHQIGSSEPCVPSVITLVIGGQKPVPRSTRASRLRAQSVERALKRYEEDDEADRLLTKHLSPPYSPASASTRPSTIGRCSSAASFCDTRTDWISHNKKCSADSLLFKSYDHLKRLAYLSSHRLRSPQVCVSTQVSSKESDKRETEVEAAISAWHYSTKLMIG